jgi:hypothetical protein
MSRSPGVKAGLVAAVALAGCGSAAPAPELARSTPLFRAEQFFAGRTEGRGSLKIIFKDAQAVRVEGQGRAEADGTLVLDQIVRRGTEKPQRRQWRIRPAGNGRYEGTLTDATDRVRGEVRGNLFHLRYPMKGGVTAEQWIYLQPDGRTALNRMRITKLGVTVGRLEEAIRKLD